jgi:hypothetical protein
MEEYNSGNKKQSEEYSILRRWELKRSNLSTEQKKEARALLYGRFGQKKEHFSGESIEPRKLHFAYDLHHLLPRGSPGCNLLPNMRLAYHGLNAKAGAPKGIENRDKDRIPPDATTSLRQIVDYSAGSKEMQANAEAEPTYRKLMWEKLEYGQTTMEKTRAIFGMAELIGVSPQATRDYYGKMTSADGPLEEYKENGKRVRVRKEFGGK